VFTDDFHARLNALPIEHQYRVDAGVGQNAAAMLNALKGNIYPGWAQVCPTEEMFKPEPKPPPIVEPTTQPGS
jgi:hypothetical protein